MQQLLAERPAPPATIARPGSSTTTGGRHRAPSRWRPSWAVALGLLGCAAFGLWVRLWMLAHAGVNSDESIVGLMADAILHGHFSAFYWGQDYGAGASYVVAGMFAVFGHSAYVLNMTGIVLAATAAVLVGAVGWTLFQRPGVAVTAAALAWVWPGSTVWNSTREYGFRGVTLVCGLIALLMAARMVRARRVGPVGAVVLGLAVGAGFWSSPEIVYYLVPVALLLGWGLATRSLRSPQLLVASAAAAVVGALPWIVANVESGFASIRLRSGGAPPSTYAERLDTFFARTLPMLLGLRVEGSGAWVVDPLVGHAMYALAALALVGGLIGLAVRADVLSRSVLGAVVAFPLLYCAFPPTIFWNDGRYGVYLTPLCALAIAGGWPALIAWLGQSAGAGAVWSRALPSLLAVAALTAAGASTVYALSATFQGPGDPLALAPVGNTALDRVVATLEHDHLTRVVGNYWTAYDLDFASGGKVIAASLDQVRVLADNRSVLASRHAVWLFTGATPMDAATTSRQFGVPLPDPVPLSAAQFVAVLHAHGVRTTSRRLGDMVAVSPVGVTARRVATIVEHPAPLEAAAG